MDGTAPAEIQHRVNLPHQLTRFIGRSVELEELKRLLRERRLVTLTGAGGAGKTRLALETAAAIAPDFSGRVYLVELASLTRPELLLETVARVFGLESSPSRPLVDALADFLCGRPAILILDNCEHLLDACAELAATLLTTCPDLSMVATSREPLGMAGECTFRVPLLSFPEPEPLPALSDLMQFEAIQLFLDRARLANPSFALTTTNAPAVARVCAHLDGLPLALELAAAALRTASLAEIAARLDQRFHLLTAPGRTSLPRHHTLAALLDWSYALLDEKEQAAFRQLGILPADWTIDLAEAICAGTLAPEEAVPVVLGLVNKSLVQVDQVSGGYRLLETMRMYTLAKLTEAGEREAATARLFDWCRNFLARGASELDRPGQQQWFLRLEREQPNYRVALEWAIAADRPEETAGLALALWPFWSARAYLREARDWFERILDMDGMRSAHTAVRARLLHRLGMLAHQVNDFDASARWHGEELAIWRELGDPNGIAMALSDLALLHFQKMELAEGAPYAEEGLAIAREGGDPATIAEALQILAMIWIETGYFDRVMPVLEECLGIWRRLGVHRSEATMFVGMARVELKLGRPGRAASLMLDALRILRPLGDYSALIEHLVMMLFFEFDVDTRPSQAGPAPKYGWLAYLEGGRLRHGPTNAARVLGAMAAWQDQVIGANAIQWDRTVVPVCEKLKAEMGEAQFEREFTAARSMSVDDIVDFAEQYARGVLAQQEPVSPRPAVPRRTNELDALTARELEVLRLVAEGLSNRQAAERLVVTPRTINAHLTSIYAKTGVTSRAGAVRFAFEHGMV